MEEMSSLDTSADPRDVNETPLEVGENMAHNAEKSSTSHQKLKSLVKSALVNIVEKLGVEFLATSTVEKAMTTSKKTMTTNVESMPMLARTIVPPPSFNFKRRVAEKMEISEKELVSVPNNSTTLIEK